MNKKHQICIAGSTGRMGQQLLRAIANTPDCQLTSAICRLDSEEQQDVLSFIGQTSGIKATANCTNAISKANFLIDFTQPQATIEHLKQCQRAGVKMVIGTTGFNEEQKQLITKAAKDIAIVMSPNMSVGVNVTLKLLEVATKALADSCDIEIIEAHHKHKIDAPSGTALKMGEVIAQAQNKTLKDCAIFTRNGIIGERPFGSIGFATIRAGDIVGDHTSIFAGIGERIEISHKASDRQIYAQGSLKAVRFLAQQSHGLFDMYDVLGLN